MTIRFKKLFLFFLTLSWFLGLSSCDINKTEIDLSSNTDDTWPFTNSDSYEYDDQFVEVKNGKAQLKPLDLLHTGPDFNQGTHVDSNFSSSLTISKDKSITSILPSRTSNVVSYWRLDGGFEAKLGLPATPDSSGSGLNSQVGWINDSIYFDGIDDHADFTSPTVSKITLVAWVKLDSHPTSFSRIISLNDNVEAWVDETYSGYENSLTLRVKFGVLTGQWHTPKDSITLGQWHHIAISYDSTSASNDPIILIDGINQALYERHTPPSSNIDDTSGPATIGDRPSGLTRPWNGNIDELALFDDNLSEEELLNIYNQQNSSTSDDGSLHPSWAPSWNNIVGYWKMDGNWEDTSTNGSVNTLSPNFNSGFSLNKKIGSKAGSFLAVNAFPFVNDPVDNSLDPSEISISAWINPDSSDSSGNIACKNTGYQLALKSTNNIQFTENGFGDILDAINVVSPGQWAHLVATSSASGSKLYINGKLQAENNDPYDGLNDPGRFYIGVCQYGDTFTGFIDDVAVWNIAISSEDVNAIYERQKIKFSSQYDSEVFNLGGTTISWPDLSWTTPLPFGKELVGDFNSDGTPDREISSDYSEISGDLSSGVIGAWSFTDSVDSLVGSFSTSSVGAPSFSKVGPLQGSIQFDGIDDYLQINSGLIQGLTNYTISTWVQPLGSTSSYVFWEGESQLVVGDGFPISYRHFDNSSGQATVNSSISANVGTWYHVVATADGTNLKIYINGSEDGSVDMSSLVGSRNYAYARIGADEVPNLIAHNMDEFSVWSRSLSSAEIRQLYRRGANRVKLQMKSCVDSSCSCKSFGPSGTETDCDGDGILNTADSSDTHKSEFVGPGGDATTFYSELYNRKSTDITFSCGLSPSVCPSNNISFAGSPKPTGPEFLNIDYSQFINLGPNKYAQYRVYMEADDNSACDGQACLPEVSSVSLNPENLNLYSNEYVQVKPSDPINFTKLRSLDIKADSCARFRLARSGVNYFYSSGAWTPTETNNDRSPASDLEDHILQFESQFGPGPLEVIGYLKSDPSQRSQCSIDAIDIKYK